ncbi:putative Vitamin b6 transporter bsu1 [Seiridium cardinale]
MDASSTDRARDVAEKEKGNFSAGSNSSDEDVALAALRRITTAEPGHPTHWPWWKKWAITVAYCLLQTFVTLTSTTYVSAEFLIEEKFNVSNTQIVALGQSMFILGTAVGPAFLGPLSDIGGRKWVYVAAILLYALVNIGCALPLNLPMLIIFQFLSGTTGSVALCNVAGTIADMFGSEDGAGQPMALFVASANIGPSIGSPVGEWIADNVNMGLPWIFWINVIIGGAFAIGMCFIPETLPAIVIRNEVKKRNVAEPEEIAVLETKVNVLKEIKFVTLMALRIMVTEPMVTLLGIYNGFAYGLLFLYLDGVFDVFVVNNGLSYIGADLTYLNFVVGVIVMFMFVPVQTWLFKRDRMKNGGVGRPEARFLTSLVMVWLFPVSLLWFAFTSDGNTSFWSPVVAGGVLGFCDPLLWLSMLNYITDAYTTVAGSAIAAFLIPSFLIAAALAHAGIAMFENMSSTWAMATLGFVSFGLVALIYVAWYAARPGMSTTSFDGWHSPVVCIVVGLVFLYLYRVNQLLEGTPEEIRKLSGSRWTAEQLKETYEACDKNTPDYTSQLPPKLERRYIVTGGNGLVGGYIVLQLLARGQSPRSIRILDIKQTERNDMLSGPATEVDFIRTDITSPPSIEAAFKEPWHPSVADLPLTVFHTAAVIIPSDRSKHLYGFTEAVNVHGTRNVLSAARDAGADIFSSTSSGSISIRPMEPWVAPWARSPRHFWQVLDEKDFSQPLRRHEEYFSNYPASKAAAERIVCETNAQGFQTGCIRPAGKPFCVTDPNPPITYGDLYMAVKTLSIHPFLDVHVPPIVILVLSYCVEWYSLLPYRVSFLKRFLPEVKGDIRHMKPALLSICTHLLGTNAESSKPVQEGGLGYKGLLTTIEGMALEILEWNREHATANGSLGRRVYTTSVAAAEKIQQLGFAGLTGPA